MANYRELDVWKDGCLFARDIYALTKTLRDFGMRDQMTRSAVSIASNIAEGSERESDVEFARFLRIAKGSCAECRTQLTIANMTNLISLTDFHTLDAQATSLNNRLTALIKYLKSK